jgi:hypothetical protein
MSIYNNCVEQGVYSVNECDSKEGSRVRGIIYLKKTATIVDPSDASEWEALIASDDAILIPRVRGTYDGGTDSEGSGFGDEATEFTGRIHTINYFDPNLNKNNSDWYNTFRKNAKNYRMFYKTESLIWEVKAPVSVSAKVPKTENTQDQVTYEVMVKWSYEDMPVQYDAPVDLFV